MSGSRLSPRPIIVGHLRALAGPKGRLGGLDLARQYGIPVAIGAVVAWRGAEISSGTAAGLLTIGGLFSAFTFQLALGVHQQALAFAGERPHPGAATSRRTAALKMLAANAAYASLVSMAAALSALVVAVTAKNWPEHVAAGVTVCLFAHLAFVLLLVLRRVYVDATATLDQIAAGDHAPETLA